MKRFYISAALFLILIFSGIASVSYLNHLCNDINTQLDAAEQTYYIDSDKTKIIANEALSKWESKKLYLSIFLNHETLDEISSQFVTLTAVCETQNESFLSSLNNLRFLLDDLIKANNFSVYSFI